MFSLSTSWNWSKHQSGRQLLEEIRDLGFKQLELGFTLSEEILNDIIQAIRVLNLEISSVHNYCPIPKGSTAGAFFPDSFSLSSLDELQRKKAIDLTLNSMDTAKRVGAKALIIHAGRLEIPSRTKDLIKLYKQGAKNTPAYMQLINDIKSFRDKEKSPYLSAIKHSLEPLVKRAGDLNLMLCIENRYYSREIPSLLEIGELIDEFAGCPNLGYWHDIGHAQANENLGFEKHIDFLEKYHKNIVGMHLHDIRGSQDHRAPGTGVFDFTILKPYIKRNTIRVLEIHQPATSAQIKSAVNYLNELGLNLT